ncbi:MAG: aspartate aminotransferase family protein [Candidatus Bathyarchaeia archaeon]
MSEKELDELQFGGAPIIKVKPPGPKSAEIIERQSKLETRGIVYPKTFPVAWDSGRGATLRDMDGNVFIDFYAGVGVMNVGHSNPFVIEALESQARKIIHILDFPNETKMYFAEKLLEIAPGRLKDDGTIFFGGPTGSDAIEAAIKLAKLNTKRQGIIAFEGGYHGMTTGALAVTSNRSYKENYLPLMPEVYRAPYAYCYRCAFGKGYPECGLECAQFVDHMLTDPESGASSPAAVLIEAIQGEAGVIVPPDGYISKIRKICDENNIVMIVDEIQTGFGRTGRMFCSEHWGVTPDIMTIAKAMGGAGLPAAGLIFRRSLDTWEPGKSHFGTFRGNALSSAAGLAAIRYMQENRLVEHSEILGAHALKRFSEIAQGSKTIGEVRGRGLFIGIEIVKDKKSKEPGTELTSEIRKRCFERGVIFWSAGHFSNVIRFIPPLVVTEELVDKGIDVFSEVMKEVERDYR